MSTVIGGLILWMIVEALKRYAPNVWTWISSRASELWDAITVPLTVPLGMVVAAGGVSALATWWFLRKRLAPQVAAPPDGLDEAASPASSAVDVLNDLQCDVLKVLSTSESQWMPLYSIAEHLNKHRLHVEQAAHELLQINYVRNQFADVGELFALTPDGRDYSIARGYVPAAAAPKGRRYR